MNGSLFETTANILGFNAWMLQDLIPKLPEKQCGSWTMSLFINPREVENE
ncbi:hypothetical protein [Holospora elegans]|nr:hypothetical protein [Holospora elegans]